MRNDHTQQADTQHAAGSVVRRTQKYKNHGLPVPGFSSFQQQYDNYITLQANAPNKGRYSKQTKQPRQMPNGLDMAAVTTPCKEGCGYPCPPPLPTAISQHPLPRYMTDLSTAADTRWGTK